jgi:hypothetical protein
MTIEEAGPDPERIAAAIHARLPVQKGGVQVEAIAKALDIVEIRYAPLKGLEGALVAPPSRNIGSILINNEARPQRRRFTLAHELGHFLNPWHRPAGLSERFACTNSDLATSWGRLSAAASRHARQEAEANRFAIELLAPRHLSQPFLFGIPDLAKVIALSDELALSREAGARRYVELHPQPCAVVFTRDGVVRYVERADCFPFVSIGPGCRLSILPNPADSSGLSGQEEADPRDWLAPTSQTALLMQTLSQRGGYAITLLSRDPDGREDDGDDED